MRGTPYTQPHLPPPPPPVHGRQLVTGRSFAMIIGALLLTALVLGVAMIWVLKASQAAGKVPPQGETPASHPHTKRTYKPLDEQAAVPALAAPVDPNIKRWAEQERVNKALLAGLEDLKNRKAPPASAPTKKEPGPVVVKYTKGLSIDNKHPDAAGTPAVPEYLLKAGTHLPCLVETAMNSDASTYFTAQVSSNVFDSATGHHLLVPQQSIILGNGQGEQLIYGNERLNTISLSLNFPDGRKVDLGKAPVTDQEGVGGLADEVDQHYGRLLAAVLIGGALKGGAQAVTTAAAGMGGADVVISGVGSNASQAAQRVTGPLLNTRPTIKVYAGHVCSVLLLEPLTLPAMWQGGPAPVQQIVHKKGKS